MLDIVFTVCLLASPFSCETTRMETDLSDQQFVQCITKAQSFIALYVAKDKFIKEFGCTRKSKDA